MKEDVREGRAGRRRQRGGEKGQRELEEHEVTAAADSLLPAV